MPTSRGISCLIILLLILISFGCANTGVSGAASGIGSGGTIGAATGNPFIGMTGGMAVGSLVEYFAQRERNRWLNFYIFPCPLREGPRFDDHLKTFVIEDYTGEKWLWGWEERWLPEKKWRGKYGSGPG